MEMFRFVFHERTAKFNLYVEYQFEGIPAHMRGGHKASARMQPSFLGHRKDRRRGDHPTNPYRQLRRNREKHQRLRTQPSVTAKGEKWRQSGRSRFVVTRRYRALLSVSCFFEVRVPAAQAAQEVRFDIAKPHSSTLP